MRESLSMVYAMDMEKNTIMKSCYTKDNFLKECFMVMVNFMEMIRSSKVCLIKD